MNDVTNELKELYNNRFGEKFSQNLDPIQELQIDFLKGEHHTESPNRCNLCYCFDKNLRQDLPFWIGEIQKDFMVIAQDAGKGIGDDFNSIFSIHKAYINLVEYRKNKKNDNYFEYLKKLVCFDDNEKNLFSNIFLTDLVKCSFTTEEGIKINSKSRNEENRFLVKCHTDIFTEINAVKPRIVYLFGQKPRDSFKSLLKHNFPEFKIETPFTLDVVLNKGKKSSIQLFRHPAFNEILFVSVPQLGDNRFSKECLNTFFEKIDSVIKPRLLRHLNL
jgi:hypothetical protein